MLELRKRLTLKLLSIFDQVNNVLLENTHVLDIEKKQQVIMKQDQLIEESKQVIENKEQVIEEKQHVIEENKQVIEEKDHLIAELRQQLLTSS